MPFGVESGVGQGMDVLDGVAIIEREGAGLEVNLGCPIVTNGDSNMLFPNYFKEDFVFIIIIINTIVMHLHSKSSKTFSDVRIVRQDVEPQRSSRGGGTDRQRLVSNKHFSEQQQVRTVLNHR